MTTKREIASQINNYKIEITFKSLSPVQQKYAYKILATLGTDKKYKGKELAKILNINTQELRTIIMTIRREMSRFTQPENNYYLISDGKGYWISKDYEEIKKYYHKLNSRHNNTKLQWLECQLALAQK